MAEAKTPEQRPLDEVMLAMDVVDTLRHREILVERELRSETRDRRLIERLRDIYASQGIDVSDTVLAEGVEALKEERFVYKPPGRNVATLLARAYVARGRWAKRVGVGALVLALIWGAAQFLVVGPGQRRLKQEVTQLNTEIRGTADRLDALVREATRIKTALPDSAAGLPKSLAETFVAQHKIAGQSLRLAGGFIASARELAVKPDMDTDHYESRAPATRETLQRREALLSQADGQIDKAQASLAAIMALGKVPGELAAQRDAALSVAKADDAKERARQLYTSGLAALKAGDLSATSEAVGALSDLRTQLEREYEIRVVSRPNEYTGVWRVPERNPKARNYYIVVEAVTPDGKTLTLPITSEEDGRTYEVNRWGLRVDLRVFQNISADKQDDGIVQNRRFGVKQRGYLEPKYLVSTTGGAITSW